ncbi:MAG: sigma-70 family RNA polymerase sigma factor [Anaerolineae bacterium]|nr:sigma-70 family RNA polymerase sigma factor [Anaerolineae bacterium]
MSATNIRQVIKRASQGDAAAITTLYEAHVDAIYRYIFYRVPTGADAEDLTAEVFLKMVEGLPGYTFTGAPFETWLYRIAAARIADFYRRANRQPQSELTEFLTDGLPLPEEHIQQNQEIDILRQALQQFSEEEQTILILRFVERKSHKEVADILGKTANAVKAAQHRTLVQLAALLGSEEKVRHYLRGDDDA